MDIRFRSMVAHWRMPAAGVAAVLLMLAGASYWPASAQAPATELQALQQEVAGLRGDIAALRTMLEQAMGPRPAPAGGGAAVPSGVVKPLTIAGRPTKGSPKARLTIVEYADYECPYCGRYGAGVYPQLDREYIKSNKIQRVFKNYPIAQLHPASFRTSPRPAPTIRTAIGSARQALRGQRNYVTERFMEHADALAGPAGVAPAWQRQATR